MIVVGPVPGHAARAWTSHMLANLGVVHARAAELPFRLPDDVACTFWALLSEWNDLASHDDVFEWHTTMEPAHVHHLVRYWVNLDSLAKAQLDRFGITSPPARARPFFDALVIAVVDAFERLGEPDPFAALLRHRTGALSR